MNDRAETPEDYEPMKPRPKYVKERAAERKQHLRRRKKGRKRKRHKPAG